MSNYKMIPVDEETKEIIRMLCNAYGMGERSQGAMVRKLAMADFNRLKALDLLPKNTESMPVVSDVPAEPVKAKTKGG